MLVPGSPEAPEWPEAREGEPILDALLSMGAGRMGLEDYQPLEKCPLSA